MTEQNVSAAKVDAGMVVVPKLPTRQMYEDGRDAVQISQSSGDSNMATAADVWEAMIAAAPKLPVYTPPMDEPEVMAELQTSGLAHFLIVPRPEYMGGLGDIAADARLVAAAPLLFEACQTFALWLHREETGHLQNWGERRATVEGEREWHEWYMENLNLCDLAQTQARAALAAALGTKE